METAKEEERKQTKVNRGSREPPRNINRKHLDRDVEQNWFHPSNIQPEKVILDALFTLQIHFLKAVSLLSTVAEALEVKVSIITSEYSVWMSRGCFPLMPRGSFSKGFYF